MINITPVHIEKQHVDFVSVEDDAIDWGASFPDVHTIADPYDDEAVLEGVEAKKQHYKAEGYQSENLVRKAGAEAFTVFRFKNPTVLANKQKIETIQTQSFVSGDPRKKPAPGEMDARIWQALFIGFCAEGQEGTAMLDCRRNGNITQEYLQGFSNAGVLKEFAIALRAMDASKKKTGKKD